MQTYKAPLEDIRFLLEVMNYEQLTKWEGYEAFDLEVVDSLLEQDAKFCVQELLPLNQSGDREGLEFDPKTGDVKTPKGFKEAYAKFVELGFASLSHPEEYGGSNAPAMLGFALSEMHTATNKSFSMCPGLTHGLIDALLHHGSDELKDAYLPKLISGEWSGTMCLTEPHCGTDLGLLKTKAVPEGDHYLLTGTKIWITFGEHDMADNIVHLVLGRLPDAPDGIKGISVFLVPKFTLDGERNGIVCGGLEHKMGIHASPTCVMNLEGAKGWLVGQPHKGMRAMFTMMNSARLSVGMEGVALGEIAYQTALAFAKDRRQGRSLDAAKQDPDAAADNIMVHPDVRRMLLNIKSTNEGMRALGYWVGIHLDISLKHPDEAERQKADDLVALLTPVIKSYLTERGFLNINEAMQVTGGAGYTTDWCIEQYMRDERIALIYEGTNHIQALDLVGRKLPRENGRLYQVFNSYISDFIRENKDDEALAEFVTPLKETSKKLMQLTMELSVKAMEDREIVGAIASNYLNVFALTALSYVWCVQAKAALAKEGRFYEAKRKTARYFFHHILPEVDTLIHRIQRGKDDIMAFSIEEF